MLSSKFEKILDFINNKKTLVLTHNLLDIDALASIISFKYLITKLELNGFYFHLSSLTKSTKDFFSLFTDKFGDFNVQDRIIDLKEIEVFIILDTNNLDQVEVPSIENKSLINKSIIFIDHHSFPILKNESQNKLNIIEDKYNSTSEIIFELFKHYNFKIPIPYIYLIAAGIISDTGFFKHANTRVFRGLASLLENKVNYQEIVGLLDHKKDLSEKIAQIKGAQRIKLYRMRDILVGVSHVSNFRAKVATNLLKLGLDISIVYSKLKKGNFITARAKKHICLETGLHLGKLLEIISDGRGGGHDGAASVFFDEGIDEKLEDLLKLIQEILIR
jgi:nanoRNase/pAp phosphatase (c-di-AMP/oligoRNAs hydrolase)